jgi:peptidoglycan hydrolase-like protein with peptidoglycan-binding domain
MRTRIVAGIAAVLLALGLGMATTGTATAAAAAHTAVAKPHDTCNYTTARPTLSQGSSGAAVRQLQCYLNSSLDDDFLAVDGQFGPQTRAAVLEFQSCDGIGVDGIVGPVTWGGLNAWANSPYWCDAGDVG